MLAFGRARTKFGKPPPGYVPGIGRGATGFTTRGDLGPTTSRGRGAGAAPARDPNATLDGAVSLFASTQRGAASKEAREDDEADEVYDWVRGRVSGKKHRVDESQSAAAHAYPEDLAMYWDPTDQGRFDDPEADVVKSEPGAPRKGTASASASSLKAATPSAAAAPATGASSKSAAAASSASTNDGGGIKVQAMFADLAQGLGSVTEDQWAAIPDAAEPTALRKRKREDNSIRTAVPDSALAMGSSALESGAGATSAATAAAAAEAAAAAAAAAAQHPHGPPGGADGPFPGASVGGALTEVGAARGKLLGVKLDQVESGTMTSLGKASVDTVGYLAGLDTVAGGVASVDTGDLKTARLVLRGATLANPTHSPGWIAAVRLEEKAGRPSDAREIMRTACSRCPDAADVWAEAARVLPRKEARAALADATRRLPDSVPVWIAAANVESDESEKRKVLRRALEVVPGSEDLWKACIELEKSPENARLLLGVAVEKAPHAVDLWLALANLEPHAGARKVLNKARQALPTEPRVWVAAAQLEEVRGGDLDAARKMASKIMRKAVKGLAAAGALQDRPFWLAEAERCERSGCPVTAAAIVEATSNIGFEALLQAEADARAAPAASSASPLGDGEDPGGDSDSDEDSDDEGGAGAAAANNAITLRARRRIWFADAEQCSERGSVETARALLRVARTHYPSRASVWLRSAAHERAHPSPSAGPGAGAGAGVGAGVGVGVGLAAILLQAVRACPRCELLWLMAAKAQWEAGDVAGARSTLEDGFTAHPASEEVWLAAAKLELGDGEIERARALLERARSRASSGRVWMKAALIERRAGDRVAERQLLEDAVALHPDFDKLWMMLGQLERRDAEASAEASARNAMSAGGNGNEAGPTAAQRALATFRRGLRPGACPDSEDLWLCAARAETQPSRRRALLDAAHTACPRGDRILEAAVCIEIDAGDLRTARATLARALRGCPRSGRLWALAVRLEPPASKRSKASDAARSCPGDPVVICTVARQFWAEGKNAKTRAWLERCAGLDRDWGDTWATWHRFERECGDAESVAAVEEKCAQARPTHGDLWQTLAKDPARESDAGSSSAAWFVGVLRAASDVVPGALVQQG